MTSEGHGLGMALFPLAAAAIAVVFSGTLTVRYLRRRRAYEGVWAVALAMYAAASFAMALGVLRGWRVGDFRVYWLFGAVLNVPYLFAGEVYLLAPGRLAGHVVLGALVAASLYAALAVWNAPVDTGPLSESLPLGREVLGAGTTPHRLAQYYSFPAYFLLLGGLVWSAWQMRARPQLRERAGGVLLIAAGATIVAIGSGIGAGLHVVPLFSASLAAGVAVMYWGFLVAARPAVPSPALGGAGNSTPGQPPAT